ncbi:hypothetical protein KZZ52_14600 [Dactylosporangium sp. AC04546]|uniref:hypothetical protein n=1 Tax=Dactylosporangium sp. AC04546 TaxID=2862460 RepID=UPI001EDF78D9|nr:hypothetical protein [Dactylosporangium sp. AC04546]WVK86548.1 hypothetical protein KZZ52_14600 [Dactylosporangium sp. AC04546]
MRRAVVVVVVFLGLAACSATPPAPEVASARQPSASGSAGPSPATKDSDYDKALRYTRCLTENGAETSDPIEGEPLVTAHVIKPGASVETMLARMAAHDKCKQFLPATWPIRIDQAEVERSRPYFDCMRSHGIDEPIPDKDGMVQTPTDVSYRSTPEYQDAVAKCRHLYDDPANDLPQNR